MVESFKFHKVLWVDGKKGVKKSWSGKERKKERKKSTSVFYLDFDDFARERENVCVSERKSVCACERENLCLRVRESLCVCIFEYVKVRLCVSV
jgi:hypothetical protein